MLSSMYRKERIKFIVNLEDHYFDLIYDWISLSNIKNSHVKENRIIIEVKHIFEAEDIKKVVRVSKNTWCYNIKGEEE